jgi:hypothetical protein
VAFYSTNTQATKVVVSQRKEETMGMDVYGKNPTSEVGSYFRNNVWWWHPLWQYCEDVAPELCKKVDGHTNSGDGLDAEEAKLLGEALLQNIADGHTLTYRVHYYDFIASLERKTCFLCLGAGIRSDEIGYFMGMHKKELSPEVQILTGRTFGWCNGCDGTGVQEDFLTNYPFNVENVEAFAKFAIDSGGFEIC